MHCVATATDQLVAFDFPPSKHNARAYDVSRKRMSTYVWENKTFTSCCLLLLSSNPSERLTGIQMAPTVYSEEAVRVARSKGLTCTAFTNWAHSDRFGFT